VVVNVFASAGWAELRHVVKIEYRRLAESGRLELDGFPKVSLARERGSRRASVEPFST
jgi:hypothetical protein